MIHWEEGEDERGFPVWLRYVDYCHWGLVQTGMMPRWIIPYDHGRSIAQVKIT